MGGEEKEMVRRAVFLKDQLLKGADRRDRDHRETSREVLCIFS